MTPDLPEEILTLFDELDRRHVRYMVVGMSAAIMQGVPASTQDIDIWFERYSDNDVVASFRKAGGTLIWRSSPPVVAGPEAMEMIDIVMGCTGLGSFDKEYSHALVLEHDSGIRITVMPATRVAISKRAADRPKDRLAVPVIEDSLRAINAIRRKGG